MTDIQTNCDKRQELLDDNARRVPRNLVLLVILFTFYGLFLVTQAWLFIVGEYLALAAMGWNLYRFISNGRKLKKLVR